MSDVYQPDPPGLMYDDLRLLPPWRGSSHFWGVFAGGFLHTLGIIHSLLSEPWRDEAFGSTVKP